MSYHIISYHIISHHTIFVVAVVLFTSIDPNSKSTSYHHYAVVDNMI